MKKIIILIIVTIVCNTFCCSCGKEKEEAPIEETPIEEIPIEEAKAIQLRLYITEGAYYLQEANEFIMQSEYATDYEESVQYFSKALELVKKTRRCFNLAVSSPNFISEGLSELEKNYEESLALLKKSFFTYEEKTKFFDLQIENAEEHVFLIGVLSNFAYLAHIRNIDQLPYDEAQKLLEEEIWPIVFADKGECPKNVDKQELYLMWAMQCIEQNNELLEGTEREINLKNFNEVEFLEELETLRKNEDLSSEDYNKKWVEFIENFIFNTKGDTVNTVSP